MTLIKQNETTNARKYVPMKLVDSTDGYTPETGLSFSSGEIKISKAGGVEANHAGSVVEVGGGVYMYLPSNGEVDTLGVLTVRITKTGVRDAVFTGQVIAIDPYTSTTAAVFDTTDGIEAGMTFKQAMRIAMSILAGKLSGAGTTTEVFRNAVADSKTRVTATVDSSGNRSGITYDAT